MVATDAVPGGAGPARTTRVLPAHRGRWALALVVVLAVHLLALYWPRVAVDGPVTWTDKVVHPLLFLAPAVVGSVWWGRWPPVVGLLAVHAVLSEVLQHELLPLRSGDPWDAAADLLGLGVALLVLVPWHRRRVRSYADPRRQGAARGVPQRW